MLCYNYNVLYKNYPESSSKCFSQLTVAVFSQVVSEVVKLDVAEFSEQMQLDLHPSISQSDVHQDHQQTVAFAFETT